MEFICKALELNCDPTRRGHWIEGYYAKHLTFTPSPILPNDENARKEIEKEIDEATKHYIFCDEFSDWNMPRGIEKHEIDVRTLHYFTGIRVYEKDFKKYPVRLWQGDIVEVGEEKERGVVVWCTNLCSFIIVRESNIEWDGIYPSLTVTEPTEVITIVSDVTDMTIVGNVFDKMKGKND